MPEGAPLESRPETSSIVRSSTEYGSGRDSRRHGGSAKCLFALGSPARRVYVSRTTDTRCRFSRKDGTRSSMTGLAGKSGPWVRAALEVLGAKILGQSRHLAMRDGAGEARALIRQPAVFSPLYSGNAE
jgi:hypothetical protein